MKILLTALFCATLLTLTACTSLPQGPVPHAANTQNAAEVYIVRGNDSAILGLVPLNVTFDGVVIAKLGSNEFVHFTADYGFHSIGISDHASEWPLEKGRTHYFVIEVSSSEFGFALSSIGGNKALKLLSEARDATRTTAVFDK